MAISSAGSAAPVRKFSTVPISTSKAAEDERQDISIRKAGYNLLDAGQRKKYIKELESEMLQAAKDLEFERAAVLRDEIQSIREMKFD